MRQSARKESVRYAKGIRMSCRGILDRIGITSTQRDHHGDAVLCGKCENGPIAFL